MMGIGKLVKKANSVLLLAPEHIRPNPFQPRREFDAAALAELAGSIRRDGLLQPLTVRRAADGGWELISGERRLRAARMAGLAEVPCLELKADDNRCTVLALIENLQREDLNFFEEAEGLARLIGQFGFTQEQAAVRVGKAQATVSNKLRLLRLTSKQRDAILAAGLTERHARALLRVPEGERDGMLARMIASKLNVADTDRLVAGQPRLKGRRSATPVIRDVRLFFNTLANAVGVMRRSGIAAVEESREFDEYYEYTVRIPKGNGTIRSVG